MRQLVKYIPKSLSSDDSLGVEILNIGHNIYRPFEKYPKVNHPSAYYFDYFKGRVLSEYQIVYIANGSGYFEANGLKQHRVSAGDILLLYPGIWHTFKPNSETGWEEYWIGFAGNYAKYLLELSCFNPQNPVLKVGFNDEFLQTFAKLVVATESNDSVNKNLASFLTIQLLGIVYSSALSNQKVRSFKEVQIYKAVDLINQKWDTSIDFKEIASNLNMSYISFRKSFKDILGIPPSQYLIMLKVRKAARLLQDTEFPIKEVAHKSGFESLYYFSRIFKQKLKKTPTEFRQAIEEIRLV